MSVAHTTYLWEETELSGNAMLVALAMADKVGNEEGLAWPSVASISRRTRLSERTVQRQIRELVEAGELVLVRDGGGRRSALYRFTMQGRQSDTRQIVTGDAAVTAGVTPGVTAAVTPVSPNTKRETNSRRETKKIVSPADEPEGFAQWLGQHVAAGGTFGLSLSVPRASTARRSALARTFARLRGEGHELEEFRLASLGVVGDAFMREGGHVDPENVLRVEKFGKRVDAGRRVEALAAAAPVETVDWSRFDA